MIWLTVFKNWKGIVVLAGLAAAVAVAGALYWYIGSLKEDLRFAQQEIGVLQTSKAIQDQTILDLQLNIEAHEASRVELMEQLAHLQQERRKALAEMERLNDLFANHDLERLARAKPGLIGKRLTAGTARINCLLEQATRGGDPDRDCNGSD